MLGHSKYIECPNTGRRSKAVASIEMATGPLDLISVEPIPDQLNINQSLDLPIFHITDWSLMIFWHDKLC